MTLRHQTARLKWWLGGLALATMAAASYSGICIWFYTHQRHLLYPGRKLNSERALLIARDYGLEPWKMANGTSIGWYAGSPAPMDARVLELHGNGGTALDASMFVSAFQSRLITKHLGVYLLEYPGYGSRPGQPSTSALVQACTEAVDQISAIDNLPLFLVGESIGTGIAAECGSQRSSHVTGMFLISPFTTITELARNSYPFLPSSYILTKDLHVKDALRQYCGTLAVFIAGRDKTVPPEMSRQVFEGFSGIKRLWIDGDAGHSSWRTGFLNPMWAEVTAFLLDNQRLGECRIPSVESQKPPVAPVKRRRGNFGPLDPLRF